MYEPFTTNNSLMQKISALITSFCLIGMVLFGLAEMKCKLEYLMLLRVFGLLWYCWRPYTLFCWKRKNIKYWSMDFISSISFPKEPLISWAFLEHFCHHFCLGAIAKQQQTHPKAWFQLKNWEAQAWLGSACNLPKSAQLSLGNFSSNSSLVTTN